MLMMIGVVSNQKSKVLNLYYWKYYETYGNSSYAIYRYFIKDKIKQQTYSGRKWNPTGFVYLKGSPYRDAEGSLNLRSCFHDAIFNSDLRIEPPPPPQN